MTREIRREKSGTESQIRANGVRGEGEEAKRARIGFLALPNRLCVAMSRARCLLVVVGCKETVAGVPEPGQPPKTAAPDTACWQLASFYEEICEGRPFP